MFYYPTRAAKFNEIKQVLLSRLQILTPIFIVQAKINEIKIIVFLGEAKAEDAALWIVL